MQKFKVVVSCCDCHSPCVLKRVLDLRAHLATAHAANGDNNPESSFIVEKEVLEGSRTRTCDVTIQQVASDT